MRGTVKNAFRSLPCRYNDPTAVFLVSRRPSHGREKKLKGWKWIDGDDESTGFKYTDEHHKLVKANLDKITAIVEPKFKKA